MQSARRSDISPSAIGPFIVPQARHERLSMDRLMKLEELNAELIERTVSIEETGGSMGSTGQGR